MHAPTGTEPDVRTDERSFAPALDHDDDTFVGWPNRCVGVEARCGVPLRGVTNPVKS